MRIGDRRDEKLSRSAQVGSGKTALMDSLCKRMREHYDIAAITNDIYTKWDAEYLVRGPRA